VTPVPATTDAIALLADSHVPPGVALVRAVVVPSQIAAVPVIAAGGGYMFMVVVVVQPVGKV
jgi:hypothetical protein